MGVLFEKLKVNDKHLVSGCGSTPHSVPALSLLHLATAVQTYIAAEGGKGPEGRVLQRDVCDRKVAGPHWIDQERPRILVSVHLCMFVCSVVVGMEERRRGKKEGKEGVREAVTMDTPLRATCMAVLSAVLAWSLWVVV